MNRSMRTSWGAIQWGGGGMAIISNGFESGIVHQI